MLWEDRFVLSFPKYVKLGTSDYTDGFFIIRMGEHLTSFLA